LWDSEKFEVSAILKKDGKPMGLFPLKFEGTPSHFAGDLKIEETGEYEAIVYAYDPANGNTGLDSVTFKAVK